MTVAPIRPDVQPEIDAAREIRDWTWMQIADHMKDTGGVPPDSVALVLIGKTAKGSTYTFTNSWSVENTRGRMEVCASAAALLQQRAIAP